MNNKKKNKVNLFVILHFLTSFYAIYLSYKKNKTLDILSILTSISIPYIYLIFLLITQTKLST